MRRPWLLVVSVLAWFCVWAFWLATTHDFHPTFALALIVTTSLVAAYAAAAYINHLVLVPWLWAVGRRWQHAAWLAATMVLLTAVALAAIRVSYRGLWGPDTDPNGAYKHYAIDLFGMGAHVGAVALIVWVARRISVGHRREAPDAETVAAADPSKAAGR